MPEDFDAFHSGSISLEVHDALRPGIVRVLGAAIEREFVQFVFSLLLEILDACLVGDCFIRVIRLVKCFLSFVVSYKSEFWPSIRKTSKFIKFKLLQF